MLEVGRHHLLRYYRNRDLPVPDILHRGSAAHLGEVVERYAATGLDSMILLPQVPSLDQVDRIAGDVLPACRST